MSRRSDPPIVAAILAADIVGYSRLVEHDEAGTLSALKGLRREVIDPLLAEHQGRIVKLMGDGALVEFGSVVCRRVRGRHPEGRCREPGRYPNRATHHLPDRRQSR